MKTVSFGAKIGGAFLAVVLMTALIGAFAVRQLGKINDSAEDLAVSWLPSVELLGQLRSVSDQYRHSEANLLLALTEKVAADTARQMDEQKKKVDALQTKYEPLISSPEEKKTYEEYKGNRDAFMAASNKLMALSRGGAKTLDETKAFYAGDSYAAFRKVTDSLEALVEINDQGAEASHKSALATFSQARIWLISLVVAAIVLACMLAHFMTRIITRPLVMAVNAVERIAAGDLTVTLQAEGKDKSAHLLQALKRLQTELSSVVGNVRQNSNSVATASAEIAQGNQDLSQRTEQQAAALEETAASMEQLGATVRQNADNARQANQLALGASSVATRGGEVVSQVVDTMKGINDSSHRIADIIGTIDGIAFQTNILALNAAVEAARAGEQGRGFAVVASEVRSLAQRSAEAAKEIKGLISASVERVERGTQLVDQAGTTMTEIVVAIQRVTDIVGEISSASAEQASGVAQIGEAVTQMDRTTQQNAALVEQSAAAAESLRNQARRMVDTVAGFKLSGADAAPVVPARKVAVRPAARAPSAPVARPAVPVAAPVERRGPNRATNVVRPTFKASDKVVASAAKSTGTDDWEAF